MADVTGFKNSFTVLSILYCFRVIIMADVTGFKTSVTTFHLVLF